MKEICFNFLNVFFLSQFTTSTSQISFEPHSKRVLPNSKHCIITDWLLRTVSGLLLTQGLSFKLYLSLGLRLVFCFFFKFPTKHIFLSSLGYPLNSCAFVSFWYTEVSQFDGKRDLGDVMLYVGITRPRWYVSVGILV